MTSEGNPEEKLAGLTAELSAHRLTCATCNERIARETKPPCWIPAGDLCGYGFALYVSWWQTTRKKLYPRDIEGALEVAKQDIAALDDICRRYGKLCNDLSATNADVTQRNAQLLDQNDKLVSANMGLLEANDRIVRLMQETLSHLGRTELLIQQAGELIDQSGELATRATPHIMPDIFPVAVKPKDEPS